MSINLHKSSFNPIRRRKLSVILFVCLITSAGLLLPSVAHGIIDAVVNSLFNTVLFVALRLLSGLFALIVALFITIVQFDFTDFWGVGESVDTAWRLLRDLANMLIIIGMLYIAFSTILKVGSAKWKNLAGGLLIMAVAVNFSKTIALIILDAGQMLMMTFVRAFQDIAVDNLTNGLMINKIYSQGFNFKWGLNALTTWATQWLMIFMMIITVLVMLVIVILLIIRIVMIWFFVAVSPIAFAGYALPALKQHASKWWSFYIKLVFFGPMLAFFLWFSFLFMSKGIVPDTQFDAINQSVGMNYTDQQYFASQSTTPGNVIKFLLAVILLIVGTGMAIKAADFGGKAAGAVWGMGGNAFSKWAHRGVPGLEKILPTGLARGAVKMFGGQKGKDWLEKKGGWLSPMAKIRDWQQKKMAESGGKSVGWGTAGRILGALKMDKIVQMATPGFWKLGVARYLEHDKDLAMRQAGAKGYAWAADYAGFMRLIESGQRALFVDKDITSVEDMEKDVDKLKIEMEGGNIDKIVEDAIRNMPEMVNEAASAAQETLKTQWDDELQNDDAVKAVAANPFKANQIGSILKTVAQTQGEQDAATRLEQGLATQSGDAAILRGLSKKYKENESKRIETDRGAKIKSIMNDYQTPDGRHRLANAYVQAKQQALSGALNTRTNAFYIASDGSGQLTEGKEMNMRNQKLEELMGGSKKLLNTISDRMKAGQNIDKEKGELQTIQDQLRKLNAGSLQLNSTLLSGFYSGTQTYDDVIKEFDNKKAIFDKVRSDAAGALQLRAEYGSKNEFDVKFGEMQTHFEKQLRDWAQKFNTVSTGAIVDVVQGLQNAWNADEQGFNNRWDTVLSDTEKAQFEQLKNQIDLKRRYENFEARTKDLYQFSEADYASKEDAEKAKAGRLKRRQEIYNESKVVDNVVIAVAKGGVSPSEEKALKDQIDTKQKKIDALKTKILGRRQKGAAYRRAAEQEGMMEEFKGIEHIEDSDELQDIFQSALADKNKYLALAAFRKLAMTYNENDILNTMGYPARAEGLNAFTRDVLIGQLGMDEQEALGFQSDVSYMAEERNHWGVARTISSKYGKLIQQNVKGQAKAVASQLLKRQAMDVLGSLNRLGWGGENAYGEGYELSLYAMPILKAFQNNLPWAIQRGQINANALYHFASKPEIRRQLEAAGIMQATNPGIGNGKVTVGQLMDEFAVKEEITKTVEEAVMKALRNG